MWVRDKKKQGEQLNKGDQIQDSAPSPLSGNDDNSPRCYARETRLASRYEAEATSPKQDPLQLACRPGVFIEVMLSPHKHKPIHLQRNSHHIRTQLGLKEKKKQSSVSR